MHLIKNCAACGSRLRFPIDKGKIRVRCRCGESFIADPDDPLLYRNASFDLSQKNQAGSSFMTRAFQRLRSIRPGKIIPAFIKGILYVKYTLQNFSVLPGATQKRIVVILILILLLIVLGVYLLVALTPKSIPSEGIII